MMLSKNLVAKSDTDSLKSFIEEHSALQKIKR